MYRLHDDRNVQTNVANATKEYVCVNAENFSN